jgi:hypothetical protein
MIAEDSVLTPMCPSVMTISNEFDLSHYQGSDEAYWFDRVVQQFA